MCVVSSRVVWRGGGEEFLLKQFYFFASADRLTGVCATLFRIISLSKSIVVPQEEEYANRLIQEFKSGLLPLTDGTTLRTFLSKLLNCDPMRISKKFVGGNCIGKQASKEKIVRGVNKKENTNTCRRGGTIQRSSTKYFLIRSLSHRCNFLFVCFILFCFLMLGVNIKKEIQGVMCRCFAAY